MNTRHMNIGRKMSYVYITPLSLQLSLLPISFTLLPIHLDTLSCSTGFIISFLISACVLLTRYLLSLDPPYLQDAMSSHPQLIHRHSVSVAQSNQPNKLTRVGIIRLAPREFLFPSPPLDIPPPPLDRSYIMAIVRTFHA